MKYRVQLVFSPDLGGNPTPLYRVQQKRFWFMPWKTLHTEFTQDKAMDAACSYARRTAAKQASSLRPKITMYEVKVENGIVSSIK